MGVVSFALVYVPKAIVLCGLWSYQAISVIHGWDGHATLVLPSYPDLGVTDIIGLLGTLLGVGGMRTYEKTQGVNNRHG